MQARLQPGSLLPRRLLVVSDAPRVLYYALGGGLGHLVRAGRFLRAQGVAENALILSASEHADDVRLNAGVAVRPVPWTLQHDIAALRGWLAETIESFEPEIVCVDCFPAGILGELAGFSPLAGRRLWHVARLLRWNEAVPLAANAPHYELVWKLEPLHSAHESWLRERCNQMHEACLQVPAMPPRSLPNGQAFWLVAHSGPQQEVAELIAYALEQRRIEAVDVAIAVASFDPPLPLPEPCVQITAVPLAGWYESARRIFGAAGFNFVAETDPHRKKRVLLPFPRRFDDQFERARRSREA